MRMGCKSKPSVFDHLGHPNLLVFDDLGIRLNILQIAAKIVKCSFKQSCLLPPSVSAHFAGKLTQNEVALLGCLERIKSVSSN